MATRSFEGPMDWEYQDRGPLDPTSPFAQAASNIPRNSEPPPSPGHGPGASPGSVRGLADALHPVFGSPVKAQPRRDNPFAGLSTPSKSQPLPPQAPRFTPQLPPRNTAPPFRNPAFTTPRRPVDEVVFSEASGAEESPAPTEMSDYPNDTPEADHRADSTAGRSLMPWKIDKASRYGAPGPFPKKHAPGKGEIRAHRDVSVGMRKRKRHNHDRDVGSVALYRHAQDSEAWDSELDTDTEGDSRSSTTRPTAHEKRGSAKGAFESFFYALNKYPNTPDHMQRWMQLGANLFLVTVLAYLGWSVVSTVRNDIYQANELARQDLMSKATACRLQYTENECAKNQLPALRPMCEKWWDCMMQNPESIIRVKVTAKQVAEIINEFSETMHLKAWGILVAFILVCTTVNVGALSRHSGHKADVAAPKVQASEAVHDAARSPGVAPGYMLVPVQTPRMQRRAMLDEGTDTDTSPLNLKPAMSLHTPSGRRSPSKGERQMSAIKYGRAG